MIKPPSKRETAKVVIVSLETHSALKSFAKRLGYKVQFLADEAISEYLNRKENKP